MKKIYLFGIIILSLSLFASCLKNETFIKTYVWLNISHFYLSEDTVDVNTPFTVTVYTQTDNSCISDLRFLKNNPETNRYQFFAQGTYINRGEPCYLLEKTNDSVFTFTLSDAGKYYFEFYSIDSTRAEIDSVVVAAK